MAKKGTKKVTQDVTTENENNIINKDTVVENTPINKDTVAESIPINKDSLETLSIVELVALEQACNKVCNRYEVGARLYFSTGDVTDKELRLVHVKNGAEIKKFISEASERERRKKRTLHTMDIDGNISDMDDLD